VKVLWTKTRHRKVRTTSILAEAFGIDQMHLFDQQGVSTGSSVRVPYTTSGTKIIKIPKAKIVSDKQIMDTQGVVHVPAPQEVGAVAKEAIPSPSAVGGKPTSDLDLVAGNDIVVTKSAAPSKPDPFAELEATIKEKRGK